MNSTQRECSWLDVVFLRHKLKNMKTVYPTMASCVAMTFYRRRISPNLNYGAQLLVSLQQRLLTQNISWTLADTK